MRDERAADGAGEVVDAILPEELDWRDLVARYPVAALCIAALGGFVLGRSRGGEIVEALSNFTAEQVARNVNELLGDEII